MTFTVVTGRIRIRQAKKTGFGIKTLIVTGVLGS